MIYSERKPSQTLANFTLELNYKLPHIAKNGQIEFYIEIERISHNQNEYRIRNKLGRYLINSNLETTTDRDEAFRKWRITNQQILKNFVADLNKPVDDNPSLFDLATSFQEENLVTTKSENLMWLNLMWLKLAEYCYHLSFFVDSLPEIVGRELERNLRVIEVLVEFEKSNISPAIALNVIDIYYPDESESDFRELIKRIIPSRVRTDGTLSPTNEAYYANLKVGPIWVARTETIDGEENNFTSAKLKKPHDR